MLVVGLRDLDVVIVAKRLREDLRRFQHNVDAYAHVSRYHTRYNAAKIFQLAVFLIRESGRAYNHRLAFA